jgi:hypothetical protein
MKLCNNGRELWQHYMYVKFSKAEEDACEAGNCAASMGLPAVENERAGNTPASAHLSTGVRFM